MVSDLLTSYLNMSNATLVLDHLDYFRPRRSERLWLEDAKHDTYEAEPDAFYPCGIKHGADQNVTLEMVCGGDKDAACREYCEQMEKVNGDSGLVEGFVDVYEMANDMIDGETSSILGTCKTSDDDMQTQCWTNILSEDGYCYKQTVTGNRRI